MFEPGRRFTLFAALRKAGRESGQSLWHVLVGYLRLRRKGRRLTLGEYLAFGLYWKKADPEAFIGVIEGAILALAINYRKNRRALVHDKMLFDAMLRGLGYPVPRLQALISRVGQGGQFTNLRSPGEIAAFLRSDARYPLFLKPARGQNSLGALAIEAHDPVTDSLAYMDGSSEGIESFAKRIRQDNDGALLVQSFIDQHPDVCTRIGRAVGSLRVITFLEAGEPKILRVFWKIPVGKAIADNLWRGNLIGAVDAQTGIVGPVRAHTGIDAPLVKGHPTTGQVLTGFRIPNWEATRTLCKSAALLMRGMPLIGWDVAAGTDGPVIIEANSVPSVELTQYPDQRGFLIGDLLGRIERELARLKTAEIKDARAQRQRVRQILGKRILKGFAPPQEDIASGQGKA